MKQEILGVKINKINKREALDVVKQCMVLPRMNYFVTPNPEFVVRAQKDEKFREILNSAMLAIPDGFGLILAAKYLKRPLDKRIQGTDFIWDIANLAEKEEYTFYLYGAGSGVAKKAAEKLKKKYPNLKILGAESGYRGKQELSDTEVIKDIKQKKPDILFVALGCPKQEKWIAKYSDSFPGVRLAMGVGGAFDYISGRVKRAPKFIRKIGLEWLVRLIKQPWRIKRIYTATVKFSWLVFKSKKKQGGQ
ncbi:WecB/TagA/CpsF family glycosyltransferase [Patescibacteria group bacterium]|nr:WecB/TagA/CpsF family glycosyltransferase [Patescibacteria group bacterium]MBU1951525.1 WecB/TagA/CpsF family glycosyltransferase [Patescibacteria group bacterium]